MHKNSSTNKVTIFYDGMCPMCLGVMNVVKNSSKKDLFELRDMHTTRLPDFLQIHDIDKEIYGIDQDGRVYKNVEALLLFLDAYPKARVLTSLFRVPLVALFLRIGYRFVARNRLFLFGPMARVYMLKMTVIIGFLIGLLMSSSLWTADRLYPHVPLFSFIKEGFFQGEHVLFLIVTGLLLLVLVVTKPSKIIFSALLGIAFLCILDQTRMQPWVVQYSFLLLALGVFSFNGKDKEGGERTLNLARLVIVFTYLYSGLQKCNATFVHEVFPWFVRPITEVIPVPISFIEIMGITAPFVQIAFALLLLTKRFRRVSLFVAVLMHCFILLMLGPFGWNWNSIVWPWTTVMILFDIILFSGKQEFSYRDVLFGKKKDFIQKGFVAVFVFLPLLSFVNLWDSYLSSALYSGNVTTGTMVLDAGAVKALPKPLQAYTVKEGESYVFMIQSFAIDELTVPPYPETRVFKGIANYVCRYVPHTSQAFLVVHEKRLFNNSLQEVYPCTDL